MGPLQRCQPHSSSSFSDVVISEPVRSYRFTQSIESEKLADDSDEQEEEIESQRLTEEEEEKEEKRV